MLRAPAIAAAARARLFATRSAVRTMQSSDSGSKATADAAPHGPQRVRIYTRTGDKGTSSLFSGERRAKDDAVFEALGTIDELSSALGLAREFCVEVANELQGQLEEIQCLLIDIGANVATPRAAAGPTRLSRTEFDVDGHLTEELERSIDRMDDALPPLRNFILPSGGRASAALHIARGVCRRAERRVVPLIEQDQASHAVGVYLNRLSDYLFTAARFAAMREGKPEVAYSSRGGRRDTRAGGGDAPTS
eukprot:Unigene4559_Nuclearia_a/m.13918 Unigene4559_Nuclearia_a/g.13918  ORF Unigene4559_Nuclearia_a/g.13918 Unigene4559_Nuclearia_a/m.13918 type:complete len:250 (+) Unigene4559_Nuclearia_a:451-1200(+)